MNEETRPFEWSLYQRAGPGLELDVVRGDWGFWACCGVPRVPRVPRPARRYLLLQRPADQSQRQHRFSAALSYAVAVSLQFRRPRPGNNPPIQRPLSRVVAQ
ncbi:hypothetical protein CI102_3315 [Trichoderma harzianum]|nr:hypothetical protein CI102_3315 [Trichoderma harzianum]